MEISELLNLDIIKYDKNIIEQQSINIEKHQILIKKNCFTYSTKL